MDNEAQYLNALKEVYETGEIRQTRNSITKSCFGIRMKFDLQQAFPILTTKRMAHKTVLRELLWFISGDTSNKTLQDKGIHIWTKNASREFLDSRGLDYQEGDLGPVYGFQWRHIGAKYYTANSNYTNKGIDQLEQLIHLIKTDPTSRRLILTAWNPIDIDKMALPPCHMTCQFYVRGKYLDCQLYQRSGDMFLGIPFNITSYSMLIHILSHCCDLKPGKLIHVIGDAHIYNEHASAVDEQLNREPCICEAKFTIQPDAPKDIDSIREIHCKLENYNCQGSIRGDMIA
jgi:thymidylate synthase